MIHDVIAARISAFNTITARITAILEHRYVIQALMLPYDVIRDMNHITSRTDNAMVAYPWFK